jgi:hypothetical protein
MMRCSHERRYGARPEQLARSLELIVHALLDRQLYFVTLVSTRSGPGVGLVLCRPLLEQSTSSPACDAMDRLCGPRPLTSSLWRRHQAPEALLRQPKAKPRGK